MRATPASDKLELLSAGAAFGAPSHPRAERS